MESDGVAREDILEETTGEEWVEVSRSQKPVAGVGVAADEAGTLTRASETRSTTTRGKRGSRKLLQGMEGVKIGKGKYECLQGINFASNLR